MFAEVPVLPVVVPLAAAVWAALVWRLHRRGLLSLPRAAVAFALCVYAAGVVANTVFPIYLDKPTTDAPWHAHLYLKLLVDYEAADALMNIGVFLPIGVLVALVAPRWPWWRVLVAGAVFSLAIEVAQFVTAQTLGGGHIADVNDLLFNVVGAVLGYGVLAMLSRASVVDRTLDRLRWA